MMQLSLLDLPAPRPTKRVHVPRTSVLAYQAGDRSNRVTRVLAALASVGTPYTSAELARALYRVPTLEQVLDVRRALSDAAALGLVAHAGERACAVGRKLCVTWRVSSR